VLAALKSFDPNAHLTQTDAGADGAAGVRLDYDPSKAPKSQGGTLGLDLRQSDFGKLRDPNAVYDDAQYGKVTNSANVQKPTDPLWTKLAPIAVGMVAPWAGAALAGAGIGGAAGLTAAATGSGLGGGASIPGWLASQIATAPSYARGLANGGDPMQMLLSALASQGIGAAGSAAGINPNVLKAGMTLAQLTRKR